MDLNTLQTFVAVCEYGGFTAAAQRLGYSQSTVSSQIRQLENELNTTLFDRIHHNITITSQGELVLYYAREMLSLDKKMENALHGKGDLSGCIRLAMPDSIGTRFFTEDYVRFHQKYPNIQLQITYAGTDQMFEMLRKNEVDLVFTLDSHIYETEFQICGESKELVHFVCAPDHPLTGRKGLRLSDLTSYVFILTEKHMSYRKILDNVLAEQSLEITPHLEIGNPEQICRILTESQGVSFLPDSITKSYIQNKSLVYLEISDLQTEVWSQMLVHKNKWISPILHEFIKFYRAIMNEGRE